MKTGREAKRGSLLTCLSVEMQYLGLLERPVGWLSMKLEYMKHYG
jgi:hypothetical protein